MHIAIEIWSPKPRFLEATPQDRATVLDAVADAIEQLKGAGIETLGWGRIDQSDDHPSGFDWFAIWQIPSLALVSTFFGGVAASGWYDWFEQLNVSGQLQPTAEILNAHRHLLKVQD